MIFFDIEFHNIFYWTRDNIMIRIGHFYIDYLKILSKKIDEERV